MLDAFTLDPGRTHLNHGSFGAVPLVVQQAQHVVRRDAESNPQRFHRVELPGRKAEARAVAASFLDLPPDELALVANVTESVATVLSSLAWQGRLRPGDAVVVSAQGYGAVRRAVEHWCGRTGATCEVVPAPYDGTDEELVAAFDAGFDVVEDRGDVVRLVVCDQITSPLGRVLPVAAISAAAHARSGLCFVDAAHAPGQLPTSPALTGADFWTGTWHKWGFAPRGTTGLWVAPAERDALVPLTTSWNHGRDFPWPFDNRGTDDYSAWLSLPAAVDFWERAGGPDVAARSAVLLDGGAAVVQDAVGVTFPVLAATTAPCLRLVALPEGVAAEEDAADRLYLALGEHGIETRPVAYGSRGWIRLSGTVYNRPEDYEHLAAVLPEVLPPAEPRVS